MQNACELNMGFFSQKHFLRPVLLFFACHDDEKNFTLLNIYINP